MKKIVLIFLLFPLWLNTQAQAIICSFLEKHGKDESIELTNIGRKMIAAMEEETDSYSKLADIISELDNISIISSTDSMLIDEYYRSGSSLLEKNKDYQSFYTEEGNELIKVAVRKENELIKELVILFKSLSSFNLVSLTGNISLEVLADYSSPCNLDNLKELVPQ